MSRPVRMVLAAVVAALMLVVLAVMVSAVSAVGDWGFWGLGWDPGKAVPVRRAIPLDAARSVVIRNSMGEVTVRGGGPSGQIYLEGEIRLRGRDLDEQQAQELLSVSRQGDTLRIAFREHRWSWFPLRSFPTADLVLTVPDGLTLDVETDMGEVYLQDLDGKAVVNTDMGAVEVRGFRGELDIKTDMGSITIAEASLSGRLSLETDMGSIDFAGVPGPDTVIDSDMGAVALTIPGDRAYRLDVETNMGSFESKIPYTLQSIGGSNGERKGVLGRGDLVGRIAIHTSMGSVEIHEGVR
ncbi:MAG: hypothetical protein DIU55_006225 [Bacillota bacterium]